MAEIEKPLRKVECVICEFIYDESKGIPEEGIEEKTKYEDMPYDWVCPDCDKGTGGNFCSDAILDD